MTGAEISAAAAVASNRSRRAGARTPRGADWPQERLAEAAAIHATYVSGIERGRRNVSIDILRRLAAAEIRDPF